MAGTPTFQRISYVTMTNFGNYTDGDDTAIASLEEWTDGTSVIVNLYVDSWEAGQMYGTGGGYEKFFLGGCLEENNYCWNFNAEYTMNGVYFYLDYWVSELTIGAEAPAIYTTFDTADNTDLYDAEEGFICRYDMRTEAYFYKLVETVEGGSAPAGDAFDKTILPELRVWAWQNYAAQQDNVLNEIDLSAGSDGSDGSGGSDCAGDHAYFGLALTTATALCASALL